MLTVRQRDNRVEITVQFEARSMTEIIDMAAHMMAGMTEEHRLAVLLREAEIRAERSRADSERGGGANG